jgi:excisionase family DNA binding protein
MPMSPRLLQIPEVARTLAISESTARRLIKAGVLPALRVGRQIRVPEDMLLAWLVAGWGQPTRTNGGME